MSESHRDERVEELLRANERLAAEVRNLSLGSGEEPGSAAMPTSRRLGRLTAERDRLQAELDAVRAELEEVSGHRAGLERQNQELVKALAGFDTGLGGFLRRARRRFSRAGGDAAPAPRER